MKDDELGGDRLERIDEHQTLRHVVFHSFRVPIASCCCSRRHPSWCFVFVFEECAATRGATSESRRIIQRSGSHGQSGPLWFRRRPAGDEEPFIFDRLGFSAGSVISTPQLEQLAIVLTAFPQAADWTSRILLEPAQGPQVHFSPICACIPLSAPS